MKKLMICWLLVIGITSTLVAQNNWHVSPTGTPQGNGTQANPWDLQTALNHPTSVLPGDTIWLHGGTYTGHFVATLKGTENNYITVRGVKNEGTVKLNGNTTVNNSIYVVKNRILHVGNPNSGQITCTYTIFRDFELTMEGSFNRLIPSTQFDENHTPDQDIFNVEANIVHGLHVGEVPNNKFINLVFHNIPGLCIISSEKSSGSEYYGNISYNNGSYEVRNKLHNTCTKQLYPRNGTFYMKNGGLKTSFENNIFFNNMRAGIQFWSASTNPGWAPRSMNENADFLNNIFFNIGSPISYHQDHAKSECNSSVSPPLGAIRGYPYGGAIIIATNDATPNSGGNIAKNVKFLGNISYNNTTYSEFFDANNNKFAGHKPNVVLGYNKNSPVKNVEVSNNVLIGSTNALELRFAKSLDIYKNLIFQQKHQVDTINRDFNWLLDWNINYNKYHQKTENDFSNLGKFQEWWQILNTNKNAYDSQGSLHNYNSPVFNPDVKKIQQNKYEPTRFHVTIMNKAGGVDTNLDFSRYNIPLGTTYTVRDVENYHTILKTGTLTTNNVVITSADMDNPAFEKFTNFADPSHDRAIKSLNNFGVFIIDFAFPCANSLTLANQTETAVKNHQVSNTITFGSGYVNETTAKVVAKAGQQIRLVPNTHIKAGSQLHTKIEACSGGLTYVGDAPFNPTGFTTSQNAREKTQDNYVMKVESGIQIYPNPTTDEFTFQSQEEINAVHIYDLSGRLVFESSFEPTNKKSIAVVNLTSGVYKVQLTDVNHKKRTHTLIKK